jgi:hypothetical protein
VSGTTVRLAVKADGNAAPTQIRRFTAIKEAVVRPMAKAHLQNLQFCTVSWFVQAGAAFENAFPGMLTTI